MSAVHVYKGDLCMWNNSVVTYLVTSTLSHYSLPLTTVLCVVAEWSKVLIPLLATYGVVHISLGYIIVHVCIMGISCHLFICTFHLI